MHKSYKNKNVDEQKKGCFYAKCTKTILFLLLKILTIVIVNDILTKNSKKYVYFCAFVYIF